MERIVLMGNTDCTKLTILAMIVLVDVLSAKITHPCVCIATQV